MKKIIAAVICSIGLLAGCAGPNAEPTPTVTVTVTPSAQPQPTVTVTQTVTPTPSPTPKATTLPKRGRLDAPTIKRVFANNDVDCDWVTTSTDGTYDGALYSCSKYNIIFAVMDSNETVQVLLSDLEAETPDSLRHWYFVVIDNAAFFFKDEKLAEAFAKGADTQAEQFE